MKDKYLGRTRAFLSNLLIFIVLYELHKINHIGDEQVKYPLFYSVTPSRRQFFNLKQTNVYEK